MAIVLRNITFNNSLVPNAFIVKTSQNIPDCTQLHASKEILNVYAGLDIFVEGELFVKYIFGCCREVKIRVNTAILEKGGRTKCARDNPER